MIFLRYIAAVVTILNDMVDNRFCTFYNSFYLYGPFGLLGIKPIQSKDTFIKNFHCVTWELLFIAPPSPKMAQIKVAG